MQINDMAQIIPALVAGVWFIITEVKCNRRYSMYKVYVVVRTEDDEEFKHELDGVLYPDKVAAYEAQCDAITEDHIDDNFDIVRWEFEEV